MSRQNGASAARGGVRESLIQPAQMRQTEGTCLIAITGPIVEVVEEHGVD